MCRFVAYLGNRPVTLSEILDKPKNSLINQSRRARQGKLGLNADGFGIGWYDHSIDNEPALFKSIQPAWNDTNLNYLAAKIRSTCFIGHVRASTVGDVNTLNCHPFVNKDFLFAHNGTIYGFDAMRRNLLSFLSDERFCSIKGRTDSEFFFALFMEQLSKFTHNNILENFYDAFTAAMQIIAECQNERTPDNFSRMNVVLTNGKSLLATRYVSDAQQIPLSLYYAAGDYIDTQNNNMIHANTGKPDVVLVASEPLSDYAEEWQEVPINHALFVDEALQISLRPIEDTSCQK